MVFQDVANPLRQLCDFGNTKTTTRHRRRPDTQATGDEWWAWIIRHRVLVHGDVGTTENFIRFLPGDVAADQAQQEQVIVGTAGDNRETALLEHFHHRLGIVEHALLIGVELRAHRFLEAHGFCRNDMHQRAALVFRENAEIEFLVQFRIVAHGQDQTTTRTTEGFVRGGGDDMRMREWIRIQTGSNKACHMGHVHQHFGAYAISNSAHTGKIDEARIGREAGDDDFRFVFVCQRFHLLVVNLAVIGLDAILHRFVHAPGEADTGTVGQVTAMRQTHAEQSLTRLHKRRIGGSVGLRTRMRLHVGIAALEQLLGTLYRQRFHHVYEFTTTVVTLSRVALGIFVGQHTALRFHHTRTGVIFGCNQLNVLFLPAAFTGNGGGQFGIETGDGHVFVKHGVPR